MERGFMWIRLHHLTAIILTSCFVGTPSIFASELYPRICLEQLQSLGADYQSEFERENNWSRPNYDQSQWPLQNLGYLEGAGTVCWFRTHFVLDRNLEPSEHKGFLVSQAGAFEVYLDGVLLGGSGKLGYSKHEEVPGSARRYIPIPNELYRAGHHVVGIKTSNFHRLPFSKDFNYILERRNAPSVNADLRAPYIWSMLSLSGCLLIAFYYLSHYVLVDRNRAYALLSLLSFAVAAFAAATITYYLDISYPLFKLSTLSAVSLAAFSCWLLPIFLAQMYSPDNSRIWLMLTSAIMLCALLLPIDWAHKEILGFGGCLLLSLVLVAVAIKQNKVGAIVVFIGVLLLLAALLYAPEDFLLKRFALFFLLLIACLLTSLSLQIRVIKGAYEQAMLNASKLEIALLKKNIQPHFLMNTLTSVIECMEFAPKQAIKFITALAEEFELICQVSDKPLIAITDEIRLCQYHLDIMGLQKQIRYTLELVNIDQTELIPPGLFHTLVENGITHNVYRTNQVSFCLTQEPTEVGKRYTLLTPKPDRAADKKPGAGLGTEYIQMRLEESYPGRWRLNHVDSEQGWLTTIDIVFSRKDSH